MNIAHPQLPIKRDGYHSTQAYTYIRIGEANGEMFALVNEGEKADLIIRAVNALEPMRKALEPILQTWDCYCYESLNQQETGPCGRCRAKAALALANGTTEEKI